MCKINFSKEELRERNLTIEVFKEGSRTRTAAEVKKKIDNEYYERGRDALRRRAHT